MRTKKTPLVLVAIVSLLVALPTVLPPTSANTLQEQDLTVNLTKIARAAVEAQNQILVGGDISVSGVNSLPSSYAAIVQEHTAQILDQRAALLERNLVYTDFHTELTLDRTRIRAARATLWATEHTMLDLESPGGPPTSGYEIQHRFDFVYEGETWTLVSDRVLEESKAEVPDAGAVPVDAPPIKIKSPNDSIQSQQLEPQSGSLTRSAIVSYATTYWNNYNRLYRAEPNGNDCTNFASQCLYNGGWTMLTGWYTSSSVWWYNYSAWFSPYHSYTWGAAHNFYWFTYNSIRGVSAQYFSQLQPGDILQVDWDNATTHQHTPDGFIDHTMIVTAKATNGEIFLTYHSNNRLNRPLSDLLRAEPSARWYGWRLYTYFG